MKIDGLLERLTNWNSTNGSFPVLATEDGAHWILIVYRTKGEKEPNASLGHIAQVLGEVERVDDEDKAARRAFVRVEEARAHPLVARDVHHRQRFLYRPASHQQIWASMFRLFCTQSISTTFCVFLLPKICTNYPYSLSFFQFN